MFRRVQTGAGAGPHRRSPRVELEWVPVDLESDILPFRLALQMNMHGFTPRRVELLMANCTQKLQGNQWQHVLF